MKKQNQPCPFCKSSDLEKSEQRTNSGNAIFITCIKCDGSAPSEIWNKTKRDKLYRIAWMSKTNKKTGISKIHDTWLNTNTRCNALNEAFPQNDYRVVSPAGANIVE